MPTLVYKYGLRPPTLNGDIVAAQMSLAHKYYNKLIEIERHRREVARGILQAHPDVAPLEAEVSGLDTELETAREAIRKERQKTRARTESDEQRQAAKALLQRLREARKRLKAAKLTLKNDAAVQAALHAVSEEAQNQSKAARAASALYWGSYLLVEQAVDAARKGVMDPQFRRWDWSGAVAVQIQHGMTPAAAQSQTDTRLQIAVGPNPKRSMVRLRVDSDGRDPVWAEWPLILHRPIPVEASIMWAKVTRERLGGKDRWNFHLTLRLPEGWHRETCGQGTVAVDIGWRRKEDGGLRVAYIVDGDGVEREITLDPRVENGLKKVDDLRSIRDKDLDVFRPWMAEWLKNRELPAWLIEATETLHQWKSQARFSALELRWRADRFEGDEEGYERLKQWRKRDNHLWLYECHSRDQILLHRREHYRVLAADLARRYKTLVIERFDLRETQKHELPESGKTEIAPARWQQRIAACSELRSCLINAFASRLGTVAELNPAYTTLECNHCGNVDEWNPAEGIFHRCSKCGELFDQDANAGKNLLDLWREHLGGDEKAEGARVKDYAKLEPPKASRWAKRGRHKGGAREEDSTSAE